MKRSRTQQTIDCVLSGVFLYVTLRTLYPDQFSEWEAKAQTIGEQWRYNVSVWRAVQAIRALPETGER